MTNHIRVKQMWRFVHHLLELNADEIAHVTDCKTCLSLFKLCVTAEPPGDLDVEFEQQKSA